MFYKHYKGEIYKILVDKVIDVHNTSRTLVVYQSLPTGQIWAREFAEFHGYVSDGRKRFVLLKDK